MTTEDREAVTDILDHFDQVAPVNLHKAMENLFTHVHEMCGAKRWDILEILLHRLQVNDDTRMAGVGVLRASVPIRHHVEGGWYCLFGKVEPLCEGTTLLRGLSRPHENLE